MKTILRAALAGCAILALTQAGQADVVTNYWDHSASGNWSDTHTNGAPSSAPGWSDINGDNVGDVADSSNIARFATQGNKIITLDSNRTISQIWYNWNGTASAGTPNSACSMTLTSAPDGLGNPYVLTLSGASTPKIVIGRLRQTSTYGNTGDNVTINAALSGTQGFTQTSQSSYVQDGLILGGSNTISGPVSAYLLTLKNVYAMQHATLAIAANDNLRLRSDTDGATFLTGSLAWSGHEGTASIDVDQATGAGGTAHILRLTGDYTITNDRPYVVSEVINITGSNGYGLELTGSIANVDTGSVVQINAVSANTRLSGNAFDIGLSGLQVGGTAASGVNVISSTISGFGPVTKLADTSTWSFSGTNTYTGTTTVNGGTLLINGGSIGTTTASGDSVSVNGGAVLGGAGGAIYGNVTVSSNGTIAAGSIDAGSSTIGTLTVGHADQSATMTFADKSILAVDVNGAASDLLSVTGSAALGTGPGDAVILAITGLGPVAPGGYKVLSATGGITIPGTLTLTGSTSIASYVLKNGNTELWLMPPNAAGTAIMVR